MTLSSARRYILPIPEIISPLLTSHSAEKLVRQGTLARYSALSLPRLDVLQDNLPGSTCQVHYISMHEV